MTHDEITDVARAAGVSVATVSRTLSKAHAAPRRERVMEAVRQLDYRPDQVAHHSAAALQLDRPGGLYYREPLFHRSSARCRSVHERDYNLIVCNTNEDPSRRKFIGIDRQLVAGITLAPP